MIIPPKHHVARLLIEDSHQKLAHAGQEHILTQLRQQFWIPKGRSSVRKVVWSCLTCKKQRATKMEQMMAALPAFRTTAYEPCFTHTGVDCFGLLNVKRGRAVVKRWGAIFTCLNSRAVHLELATSLTSLESIGIPARRRRGATALFPPPYRFLKFNAFERKGLEFGPWVNYEKLSEFRTFNYSSSLCPGFVWLQTHANFVFRAI